MKIVIEIESKKALPFIIFIKTALNFASEITSLCTCSYKNTKSICVMHSVKHEGKPNLLLYISLFCEGHNVYQ